MVDDNGVSLSQSPLPPLPFASLLVIVVAFHVIATQHHGLDNLCNVQCVMHNDISPFFFVALVVEVIMFPMTT
jgi:hypothetical protein